MSRGTWEFDSGRFIHFAYGAVTVFGRPFQNLSAMNKFFDFPRLLYKSPVEPRNPNLTTRTGFNIRLV